MNINLRNIAIELNDEKILVNLKWLRGASRYNNGGTIHKGKHIFRLILSRASEKKRVNLIQEINGS